MSTPTSPFLHFFVKNRRGRTLVSPLETEQSLGSGAFFAPLRADGILHNSYRFNYTILGFVAPQPGFDEVRPSVLEGVARSIALNGQTAFVLICQHSTPTVRLGRIQPTIRAMGHPQSATQLANEYPLPVLRRTRGTPFEYAGKLVHPDFKSQFVELQEAVPRSLDTYLEKGGISVMGCDAFAHYAKS